MNSGNLIYTAAIGISAFLLFLVQPFISKLLLPQFGGGASIWITSMVFFQLALLLGYGVTHYLVRHLGLKTHLVFTLVLFAVSLPLLPIGTSASIFALEAPRLELLLALAAAVGLPYLLLATMSPTLQYCIANDSRMAIHNPYVQYGISNLGSMLGLLAYPFFLEIQFSNTDVSFYWSGLFVAFGLLMISSYVGFYRNGTFVRRPVEDATSAIHLRWVFLAAVPSALLVVTTHFLTLDVANLPLLWVAPLALYLLTFILSFLVPSLSTPGPYRTLMGVLAVGLLVAAHQLDVKLELKIFLALAGLFGTCLLFHSDLERSKPHKLNLTGFYLQVATGGCVGSLLTAVAAPYIFNSLFEFYVVLVVSLYYIIANGMQIRASLQLMLRFGVIASIAISYIVNETTLTSNTVQRARSFYSTYAVKIAPDNSDILRLIAGTHVHGEQFTSDDAEHEPISYYHRKTALAYLFESLNPKTVAAVGLGVGTLVEYGDEDTSFDLYEIDPLVVTLANQYFTILSNSPSTLNIFIGDGRVKLRDAGSGQYDLVVMDAFSSGSIPVHLITLEAIAEILARTKSSGAIAYHVSNHYIDLLPVLYGIADELDIEVLSHLSATSDAMHQYPATWVVLTRNPKLAARLRSDYTGWQSPPHERLVWRDDFSNLWEVIR